MEKNAGRRFRAVGGEKGKGGEAEVFPSSGRGGRGKIGEDPWYCLLFYFLSGRKGKGEGKRRRMCVHFSFLMQVRKRKEGTFPLLHLGGGREKNFALPNDLYRPKELFISRREGSFASGFPLSKRGVRRGGEKKNKGRVITLFSHGEQRGGKKTFAPCPAAGPGGRGRKRRREPAGWILDVSRGGKSILLTRRPGRKGRGKRDHTTTE